MCLGAILNARISTLIYGVEQPQFGAFSQYKIKAENLNIVSGIRKDEILKIMKTFFSSLRLSKKNEGKEKEIFGF
jgi:tRNA(Arg) A34 adenosine deaminase TadA